MNEKDSLRMIEKYARLLPKLPDGSIDYTESKSAPVTSVFVKFKDRILLLKRSNSVATYKGKWNAVTGYLDQMKPLHEKVLEELREELGIGEDQIHSIHIGKPFEYKDPTVDKTWIINPVVVELKKMIPVVLDWEHSDFRWIKMEEIKNFDIIPKLDKSLENAFK